MIAKENRVGRQYGAVSRTGAGERSSSVQVRGGDHNNRTWTLFQALGVSPEDGWHRYRYTGWRAYVPKEPMRRSS